MKILAIETSCDETAVAVVESRGNLDAPSFSALSNVVHSQIEVHKEYGGVFPNLAKREHSKNLVPVLEKALSEGFGNSKNQIPDSKQIPNNQKHQIEKIFEREPELLKQFLERIPQVAKPEIDALAVTSGPGLEPALWVGINFAKALSLVWQTPVVAINHMEGHIASVLLAQNKIDFPALALLISGGHTELVAASNWKNYRLIGKTRDDAVGEAFDKAARILGLPYPGGPEISALAKKSRDRNKTKIQNSKSQTNSKIKLPRPMINSQEADFSFSGLKTAVLYLVRNLGGLEKIDAETKQEIAREFEDAVVDILLAKTKKAIEGERFQTLIVGGGVSANKRIRESLAELARSKGLAFRLSAPELSTDNAVMIALAGFIEIEKRGLPEISERDKIKAEGNLTL